MKDEGHVGEEVVLEILGEYSLEWPLEVRPEHPDSGQGHLFRLQKLTTYSSKTRCVLCGKANQAERIVTIINETTGETTQSGLDCLGKYFRTSRRDVESHVEDQAGFAAQIGRLSGKTSFTDEREVVQTVLALIDGLPEVSGIEEGRRLLQEMLDPGPVSLARAEHVVQFVLEVRAAAGSLSLFQDRVRALYADPMWREEDAAEVAQRRAFMRIGSPFDLSPELVERMNEARYRLLARSPAKRERNTIHPWTAPNEAAYRAALEAHYIARAEGGDMDTRLLERCARGDLSPDDLARKLPVVTGLTLNAKGAIAFASQWEDQPRLLGRIARAGNRNVANLHVYLSPRTHSAEVRRGGRRAEFHTVLYRSLAVWEIREWKDVYALWNRYEAQGGRDYLLKPPRLP